MIRPNTRKRYSEIGRVLARYEFEWLWSKWGIGKVLGQVEKRLGRAPTISHAQPERLRLAIEELGTTFIKVGQMLSTRTDLLPPEYIAELSKLQDDAPKVPYNEIVSAIELELGGPPESIFRAFQVQARAAGSVAQVHNAELPDGTKVVVKVRRPGIELQVDQDLAILGQLSRFLANETEFGRTHDVGALVDEFAYTLRSELDFVREGQNAERIAAQFSKDGSVKVPTIYWDYSSRGVLTMEDVGGIKIDDFAAMAAAGIDRKELAKKCANIALVQVLDNGFFHADPHPGNFFVQPNGVIALVDYGMVGQLGERLRTSLVRLFIAIARKDTAKLIDELLAMGAIRRHVDRQRLGAELQHLLSQYDGRSLGAISPTQIFREVTSISQRFGLTLPSDLLVLTRVIAMDEAMGAALDPDFRLVEFARPYMRRFWRKNHSPEEVYRRIKEGAIDLADFSIDLPARLHRLEAMLERGEVTFTSRLELPDPLLKQIQLATNRIAMSVLTAGMIAGLSVLASVSGSAGPEGFGYYLVRSLLFAGVLCGGWLFFSLWKSTRPS